MGEGWQDGSEGEALAAQAQQPEFGPRKPCKSPDAGVHVCNPITPGVTGESPGLTTLEDTAEQKDTAQRPK